MSLMSFVAWVVLSDFAGRIPAYFIIVEDAFKASGINYEARTDNGLLS